MHDANEVPTEFSLHASDQRNTDGDFLPTGYQRNTDVEDFAPCKDQNTDREFRPLSGISFYEAIA